MLYVYEKEAAGGGSDFVVISAEDHPQAIAIARGDAMIGEVTEFDDDWLNEFYDGAATLSTCGF